MRLDRWSPYLAVLALSAVVLAGCADRTPDVPVAPPDPPTPVEVAAEVTEPARVTTAPLPVVVVPSISTEPANTIKLSELLGVTVRVQVRNAIGPHSVIADFIAPGAIDYQRKVLAIDTNGGEQTVVFDLPVAGTLIDQQKLTGSWSVRLFVDGERLATPTFEITP